MITQVVDTTEGLELLDAVRDLLNQCWAHRDTIQPVTAVRRAPRPLDVWTLLPQTNCKQCGGGYLHGLRLCSALEQTGPRRLRAPSGRPGLRRAAGATDSSDMIWLLTLSAPMHRENSAILDTPLKQLEVEINCGILICQTRHPSGQPPNMPAL